MGFILKVMFAFKFQKHRSQCEKKCDDRGKTTNEKFIAIVQTKYDRARTRIMADWWKEHIQIVLATLV